MKVTIVIESALLCCRVNTPRKQGGLGNMKIPLLADKTMEISRAYGVLKEDEGIPFRLIKNLIKSQYMCWQYAAIKLFWETSFWVKNYVAIT